MILITNLQELGKALDENKAIYTNINGSFYNKIVKDRKLKELIELIEYKNLFYQK